MFEIQSRQKRESLKNIIPDQDGVTVETDHGNFHTRVVVGADGSNGVTRRCILPNAPISTARVLEVITPVVGYLSHKSKDAYFDFFAVPDNIAGYTWDFPTQINGEAVRCWGIYDTNLLADEIRPALKATLADEMARHGYNLDDF